MAGRREQLKSSIIAISMAIGVVAVPWLGLFGGSKRQIGVLFALGLLVGAGVIAADSIMSVGKVIKF